MSRDEAAAQQIAQVLYEYDVENLDDVLEMAKNKYLE